FRDRSGGRGSGRGARDHHSDLAPPAVAQCAARRLAQTLMLILENLWIIPLLPLLGSASNGLLGAKWPNKIVNGVAVGSTGISFLCALEAVREFFQLTPEQIPVVRQYFSWIVAGNFR